MKVVPPRDSALAIVAPFSALLHPYGALCLSLFSPVSPRAECRTSGASLPLASHLLLTVGATFYNRLWQDVALAVAIFQAAMRGAATGTAFDVSAAQA